MKYEICLSDTKEYLGRTLYRIQALKDFCNSNINVSKGDIGGWVESEDNLSQEGLCWVGRNAMVLKKAKVLENALVTDVSVVTDNAIVCGNAYVHKDSYITDHAIVSGVANLCGGVRLHDYTRVLDRATVRDITLKGRVIILDAAGLIGTSESELYQQIGLTLEGNQIIGGSGQFKQPFNFTNLNGYYRGGHEDEQINQE